MKSACNNLVLGILCMISIGLFAQVSVSPASDKGLCIGATFAPLGSNITITETANNAFPDGGTYEIRVPANFEIENGSETINFSGGNDITNILVTYPDARTIALEFETDGSENTMDQITVTFDILATSPSSFGTIIRSGGSAAANNQIHGVVSSENLPYISGLMASYCNNESSVTIYGVPSRGVFSGNGITDNGNGSASFNPAAGGAGSITFTVSNGVCQGVENESVIIKTAPFVSITSPSTNDFTTSAPPISLVGNPGGGTFTGPAVSNNKFYPASAGAGTHLITYTYTNGQGCTGTATRNFEVTQGGYVFPCLPAEICLNNASVIDLEGCNFDPDLPPGKDVYDYVVFNQNTSTYEPLASHYFNPNNYSPGYQYVGFRVCTDPCNSGPDDTYAYRVQIVYIKASGSEVYMYPLPSLCLGQDPLNLNNYAFPSGGSFTCLQEPSAITQNMGQYLFSPNAAGGGTVTVRYNPPAGACGNAVEKDITIYPSPYETGAQLTISSRCFEDTITLTDLTAIDNVAGQTNNIDRIYWYVDNTFNQITQNHVLNNKFNLPGNHNIDVYVYSNNGCYNHYQKQISLGAYPSTDFRWVNDCYNSDGTNPPTQFTDESTISFGTIDSRSWYFGELNASNIGNNTTVNYLYSTPGQYSAKLVTVSNTGCADSIQYDNVNIYPVYAPTAGNPYSENFRSNQGYWGITGNPSSWTYGAVSKSIITNTKNYWVTDGPDGNYLNAENSQLQSPCFDFTNLDKPMIAMRIWSASPNLIAGTVLEYSINDGNTWTIIGDKGQGEAWYDEIGIAGSPGSTTTNVGWTGTYSGWHMARIGLSNLANQPNVKFRLNFGAPNDENIPRSDGFALDSVWIGERTHVVLMEHFTNTSAGAPAQNANTAVDNMRLARRNDVAVLQYHTSFPGSDPFAAYNFSDPGARVLYYGVSSVPRTVVDGNYYNGNVYSGGTPDVRLDVADIDYQALRLTNFDLSINCVHNPGISTAGVRARYTQKLPTNQLMMHVVMVEDTANGNNSMNAVVRKMLPDAVGTPISAWGNDSTFTAYYSWPHNLPANARLGIVVYIQDLMTKEVYQAAFLKGSGTYGYDIVDGVLKPVTELAGVFLYPNPTQDILNVSLPEGRTEKISYSVLNGFGQTVLEGSTQRSQLELNTREWNKGVYTIQIRSVEGSTSKRFVVQ